MRLRRRPREAQSWELRSRLRLEAGDCAGGWAALMRAFAQDPRLPSTYAEGEEWAPPQGGSRRRPWPARSNGPPAALLLSRLDAILSRRPALAEAWAWRGALRRRVLNYAGAVADLDRAWALGLRSSLILTWRGEARVQILDFNGGRRDLGRALTLPCRAWNHAWCGRVLLTLCGDAGGLKHLDTAIKLDPGFAWHYAWRAMARQRLGDSRGMFEDFRKALRLDRRGDYRCWVYAWRGLAFLKGGRPRRALRDFDRAVEAMPGYAPALWGRAQACRALGRFRDWIEGLDHAARINSKYLQSLHAWPKAELESALADVDGLLRRSQGLDAARRWRGFLLARLGRFQEAISELDRVVGGRPRDALARLWRGEALCRAGRLEESQADLDETLRLEPGSALARAARAKVFIVRGRLKQALRELETAGLLDQHCAPVFADLGSLRLMMGSPQGAVEALERAVAKDRRYASAYADLGLARGRLGDGRGERRDLRRAFQLDSRGVSERLRMWAGYWNDCGAALTFAHREALARGARERVDSPSQTC